MVAVRSALFLLLMVFSVIVYASTLIVLGSLLPMHTRARIARGWARLVLRLLRVICGLGVEVRGWENLPRRPSIVLCKHQSAWETIALRGVLPVDQTESKVRLRKGKRTGNQLIWEQQDLKRRRQAQCRATLGWLSVGRD